MENVTENTTETMATPITNETLNSLISQFGELLGNELYTFWDKRVKQLKALEVVPPKWKFICEELAKSSQGMIEKDVMIGEIAEALRAKYDKFNLTEEGRKANASITVYVSLLRALGYYEQCKGRSTLYKGESPEKDILRFLA